MKIFRSSKSKTSGGALFFTVVLLAFVAFYLVSYMLLTENEYISVSRSQVWNAAMVNAEAGVEEAMAMINLDTANWPSMTTANGWTVSSNTNIYTWLVPSNNTVYQLTRTNFNSGNQIGSGGYTVYINYSSGTTNGPEIFSVGYANWSRVGTRATNAVRKVYVQTSGAAASGNSGLVAYQLTFNGNNVTIDSYNSASPLHSIWQTNLWLHGTNYGTWSDTLSYISNSYPSRTANVHVAAETNYIDVGNANVYGYVNTSPGGTYGIKNNGSVGDLNWVHNGTSGLQTGHFRDDMNQTFQSTNLPTLFTNSVQVNNWLPVTAYTTTLQTNGPVGGAWFWVKSGSHTTNFARIGGVYNNGILTGAGTIYQNVDGNGWTLSDGNTYNYIIPNRPEATNFIYYTLNQLGGKGKNNNNLFVDSPYVMLYLTNGMNSPILTINTNSDATIFSTGDITFGTTVNAGACARALNIYDIKGHPITITASGNACGVANFFVPSSSMSFNGGGNNTYDMIGQIVCNNVNFNGHFNLHYDESLGSVTPATQTIATAWKEVY